MCIFYASLLLSPLLRAPSLGLVRHSGDKRGKGTVHTGGRGGHTESALQGPELSRWALQIPRRVSVLTL